MGNVDTVRKVAKKTKAIRGHNSGPGSLMWYTVFDYIFYNAFRIYQYTRLESKMGEITTVKQLHREKQKVTFRSFLFKLSDPDCFGKWLCRSTSQAYENISTDTKLLLAIEYQVRAMTEQA